MKGWNKRYFILSEDILEYYRDPKKHKMGKSVRLKYWKIIDISRDHVIQLNTGDSIMSIKFSTDIDKKMWLIALEKAIKEAKKKRRKQAKSMAVKDRNSRQSPNLDLDIDTIQVDLDDKFSNVKNTLK